MILLKIIVLLFGKTITIFFNVVIAPSSIKAQFKLLNVTTFGELILTEKIITAKSVHTYRKVLYLELNKIGYVR